MSARNMVRKGLCSSGYCKAYTRQALFGGEVYRASLCFAEEHVPHARLSDRLPGRDQWKPSARLRGTEPQ